MEESVWRRLTILRSKPSMRGLDWNGVQEADGVQDVRFDFYYDNIPLTLCTRSPNVLPMSVTLVTTLMETKLTLGNSFGRTRGYCVEGSGWWYTTSWLDVFGLWEETANAAQKGSWNLKQK